MYGDYIFPQKPTHPSAQLQLDHSSCRLESSSTHHVHKGKDNMCTEIYLVSLGNSITNLLQFMVIIYSQRNQLTLPSSYSKIIPVSRFESSTTHHVYEAKITCVQRCGSMSSGRNLPILCLSWAKLL